MAIDRSYSGSTLGESDGQPRISNPRLISTKIVRDSRGCLGVIEAGDQVEFSFERLYFLTDLTAGNERGGHAHKSLRQVLICLRGAVTIELSNSLETFSFTLTSYEQALVIPPGFWRVLKHFSSDCLVGVLASSTFDESDYIRNYEEFVAWTEENSRLDSVSYLPLSRYSEPEYTGSLPQSIYKSVRREISSGFHIGGPSVAEFETRFADYCGVPHCIGVANGLEAIQLALEAKGIGSGDEVIVPAHTFVATALAVHRVGAKPVLIDVESETGSLDVSLLTNAISPQTRAIIPVHLYGIPVDMDPLLSLARERGLFVLEDAAQAHGAYYRGRRVGSLGDAAAFSFYPTKNLGALGDGGAVTTNDAHLAESIRKLANYGSQRRYHHELIGMNSRLDPIQAAPLSTKLPFLDKWNLARRKFANHYIEELGHISGLTLLRPRDISECVWHVFPVLVKDGRRSELAAFLAAKGIGTNIHYPVPLHRQACFSEYEWASGSFPQAERFADEVLSLPLDPLHKNAEIEYVIKNIVSFFGES